MLFSHKHLPVGSVWPLLLLSVLFIASCSPSSVPSATTPTTPHVPTPTVGAVVVPQSCQPASPESKVSSGLGKGVPEIQGHATNAEVWTLPPGSMPYDPKKDLKFVWHMTGTGTFQIVALHPHVSPLAPIWGPEAHGSSSWDTHPGDEWGVGFNFPTAGCWDLHVTRAHATGDVWITVR